MSGEMSRPTPFSTHPRFMIGRGDHRCFAGEHPAMNDARRRATHAANWLALNGPSRTARLVIPTNSHAASVPGVDPNWQGADRGG